MLKFGLATVLAAVACSSVAFSARAAVPLNANSVLKFHWEIVGSCQGYDGCQPTALWNGTDRLIVDGQIWGGAFYDDGLSMITTGTENTFDLPHSYLSVSLGSMSWTNDDALYGGLFAAWFSKDFPGHLYFVAAPLVKSGQPDLTFAAAVAVLALDHHELGAFQHWGLGYDVVAIPEPQAWALLVGGFGLIGAAARRRRHLQVSSHYST